MRLTRKQIRDIVVDAIEEVTSVLTVDEDDEIADIVARKLGDECPELVEDEMEDDDLPADQEDES